jgi:hypothetical protein
MIPQETSVSDVTVWSISYALGVVNYTPREHV